MRRLAAVIALLAGCAGARAPSVTSAAAHAAVAPTERPVVLPEPPPPRYAAWLAARLEGMDLASLTANWPRRPDLPKPEKGYDVAFAGEDLACDGWRYEIVVDLERPRVVWVRAVGTIAGIREYRGPAEVVDDSGPVVLRVGE